MNLQEYIAQQTAPSVESVDLLELLSTEAAFREEVGAMGQALNVVQAIDALDIDKLSNEAYQVGVESILTTAGMDHIPLDLVVPSFESSQALAISSGAAHEEKAAKKAGILKRVWDFIKGLWQKIKAKFLSIFKNKRAHTQQLLSHQHQLETAAASMGYKLVGHGHGLDGSANPVSPHRPDDKQAPGGHRQSALLGYDTAKSIQLNFLGHNAHDVVTNAHALVGHITKMTDAVESAFGKLLNLDYTNMPSGIDLVKAVGGYRDTFKAGETAADFVISRMGAQVITHAGKSADFKADPNEIPVKELLQARHALVAAWDDQTKKIAGFNQKLDVLEKIIASHEAKIAHMTDAAEIEKSQNAANGINRGLNFAAHLASYPVENVIQPALREIDKLLGVKKS